MANELRICGIVHNVEQMEVRTTNEGKTFYSQRFNLSYYVTTRDGRDIKKFVTIRLEGDNISRYAGLITNSYTNQTFVTAWVDIAKNNDDFFTVCNAYRMEEGDHTLQRIEPARVEPGTPIVGIEALGPRS